MQGNLEVTGAIVGNLDDLDDVVITSPTDNQALTYDSASGDWVNETVSGADTGSDRVVETATTRTISDTFSLVVSQYLAIQGTGTLALVGDAVLHVI